MTRPTRKAPRAALIRLLQTALPVLAHVQGPGQFLRTGPGGLVEKIREATIAECNPSSLPPTDEPVHFQPVRQDAVVLSHEWMRLADARLPGYTALRVAGTTYHADRELLLFWCRLAGIAVDYTAGLDPVEAEEVAQ